MTVKIRRVKSDHAAAITAVQIQGWQTAYRGIMSDDFLDNLDNSAERRTANWRRGIERDDTRFCFYVAEDENGAVVGFANGGAQRDENIPLYDAEIYALYILSGYRGQNIGRKLVTTSAQYLQAQGYQTLLIWVLRDNPYRAFYEALGGNYITEKTIKIGGDDLIEVAYGWDSLAVFQG